MRFKIASSKIPIGVLFRRTVCSRVKKTDWRPAIDVSLVTQWGNKISDRLADHRDGDKRPDPLAHLALISELEKAKKINPRGLTPILAVTLETIWRAAPSEGMNRNRSIQLGVIAQNPTVIAASVSRQHKPDSANE
jgi:hypothetical protein